MVIDVGALVDGYHSDMTRSFVDRRADRRAAARSTTSLLDVQLAGLAAVARRRRRPATSTPPAATWSPRPATATGTCTAPATASGSLIHEDPFESPVVDARCSVAGDVVTVEPGLYRVGFGGFRIEDLVEVTDDGLPHPHRVPEGHSMPAITTNDLKTGITLELDNGLFQVVEFQHVKPGKGGAFVRTKLRNVKTGNVFDRTFNAGIRVEQAIINREDMQFLYRDGDDYVFMNNATYDQMNVAAGRARRRRRLHGREA